MRNVKKEGTELSSLGRLVVGGVSIKCYYLFIYSFLIVLFLFCVPSLDLSFFCISPSYKAETEGEDGKAGVNKQQRDKTQRGGNLSACPFLVNFILLPFLFFLAFFFLFFAFFIFLFLFLHFFYFCLFSTFFFLLVLLLLQLVVFLSFVWLTYYCYYCRGVWVGATQRPSTNYFCEFRFLPPSLLPSFPPSLLSF